MRPTQKWALRLLGVLALTGLLGGTLAVPAGSGVVTTPTPGKVLILDLTLDEGATYNEADAAADLGFTVDVVTATEWAALTAPEFAAYRAIVFADPDCQSDDATTLAAPLANKAVWGPVVNGNVLVHTFDPLAHDDESGALALIDSGVDYATAVPGKTGMYLSTSCYDGPTVASVLDGVAPGWTYVDEGDWDNVDCDVPYFVNPFPSQLAGLTEESLSDWGCSTHAFFDTWPASFTVLAIISERSEGESDSVGEEGAQTQDHDCSCIPADAYVSGDLVGSPVMLVRPALADPPGPVELEPTFTG